jgi:pimeloyl-ACP methyl ester carboxylesterase
MSDIALLRVIDTSGTTPTVVALHCSGSSGHQWGKLASALGDRCKLITPDLIDCGTTPPWRGSRRFRLADEAARIVDIIDAQDGPVHLVGHSYGACVALCVAHERPECVVSLSLYEPTAFYILPSITSGGQAALEQIRSVAGCVSRNVMTGDNRAAASRFVDYWSGEGTWDGMKPDAQAEVVRYIPKAPLEFHALIEEPTPLSAFSRMALPVLLMRGALAPKPTALIAQKLFSIIRDAVLQEIPNAGHMGPFSHAGPVNDLIAAHVLRAADLDPPEWGTSAATVVAP